MRAYGFSVLGDGQPKFSFGFISELFLDNWKREKKFVMSEDNSLPKSG